ncbi:MAG: glycoside hydrolase family 27 protein [Clostridia bacterium]|nr:glycoside hydrolase family 27 protein [Clostridia bacterium]
MNIPKGEFYQGGDAKTPPMGWSSWNTFRNHIDEKLIEETADALVSTGLADAGYKYVNLDDCWHSSLRDENGRLQGDLVRFASGIDTLSSKIRSKGLKIGLYSSNGDFTCEDLPASLGNEKTDAATFVDWGVEYFKYDFCHNIKIPSAAPLISAIEIKNGDNVTVIPADKAKLSGLAKLDENKKFPGKYYISLLGHGKGSAVFEYESDSDSECDVTLCIRKTGRFEKYIVIQNNSEYYELFIPCTKIWTVDGRYQTKINVKKGKNELRFFNPVCTRADSAYIQYKRMGEALRKASDGKITYSICEWGRNKPKDWAWNTGNLWRISGDIIPNWRWINHIYNMNLKLGEFAGPGHWNDPDMLEVGNGKLTYDENKTHFSLWCMMASPLILGNDLRKLPDEKNTLEIISNKKMIAINQDKLGHQCIRYKKNLTFDYLFKKLENGKFAICIYNKSAKKKTVDFDFSGVPAEFKPDATNLYEVWSNKAIRVNDKITIDAHGCVVITDL